MHKISRDAVRRKCDGSTVEMAIAESADSLEKQLKHARTASRYWSSGVAEGVMI